MKKFSQATNFPMHLESGCLFDLSKNMIKTLFAMKFAQRISSEMNTHLLTQWTLHCYFLHHTISRPNIVDTTGVLLELNPLIIHLLGYVYLLFECMSFQHDKEKDSHGVYSNSNDQRVVQTYTCVPYPRHQYSLALFIFLVLFHDIYFSWNSSRIFSCCYNSETSGRIHKCYVEYYQNFYA